MRYTQNGIAITKFRLAVDRPFGRDESGQKPTDFIDIVAWRKTAELCGQYLGKGSLVGIEGRIQTRSWQTQDGQQRSGFEVQADRVAFLESRAERQRRESLGQSADTPPEEATPPPPAAPAAPAPAAPAQPEQPPAGPAAASEDVVPPLDEGDDPFSDQ
jgi:single-strand DNA-binding protein